MFLDLCSAGLKHSTGKSTQQCLSFVTVLIKWYKGRTNTLYTHTPSTHRVSMILYIYVLYVHTWIHLCTYVLCIYMYIMNTSTPLYTITTQTHWHTLLTKPATFLGWGQSFHGVQPALPVPSAHTDCHFSTPFHLPLLCPHCIFSFLSRVRSTFNLFIIFYTQFNTTPEWFNFLTTFIYIINCKYTIIGL